ncbi:MAG TPA: DNA repair protein RecO [Gemmatimonadaceae bacterium]|nr:DNA repair protein RecO [Gemmatimonadaceae bacterium]
MAPVTTKAIVLHAFDYLESSRILRLATRDAGVQSAIARGARRSRARFSALDLFTGGVAELHLREGRELQTLAAFDVTDARVALAADLGRFAAAAAVGELVLRFGTSEASGTLFDILRAALDAVADAPPELAGEAGLSGIWRLVGVMGFAPATTLCASCHAELDEAATLSFSHTAGGALCPRCAPLDPARRSLPASARAAIAAWGAGGRLSALPPREMRAHQRLAHEFVRHHLGDGRALHAFDAWERGAWCAA